MATPHPHEQSTLSTTAAQVHSSPTATASSPTMTSSEEEEEDSTPSSGGVGCPIRATVAAVAPKCETECAKQFLHEMIRNHKY